MERKFWVPFCAQHQFLLDFYISFFYCNMLSISYVYYELIFNLYFLLLLSRQTTTRNIKIFLLWITEKSSSSVFGVIAEEYRNYCIHDLLVRFSRIISEYLSHFFIFRVNCLCCVWAVTCHLAPSPSLQYCWKQQDWYGPCCCRGYKALGALSFSLHVTLHRHFLSWNVCWNG